MQQQTPAGNSSWLDQIWDKGLEVFDKITDLELSKIELDIAKELEIFKTVQATEQARREAAFANNQPVSAGGGGGFGLGLDTTSILLLVAGGVGLYLLMR